MVENGYVKGLVALLIYYSSKDNFKPNLCTSVLKCMANFSLINKGIVILL